MITPQRLRYRLAITSEVLRAPRVELCLSNTTAARRRHAELTARHPTLHVVSRGGFGAALMPLPDSMDDYLKSRTRMRRNRRKAIAAGFEFTAFHGPEHVDDMLAIHRSAPVRQGQPMHGAYLDEATVEGYAARARTLSGIVDRTGVVRAYAHTEIQGELGSFQRLIGHADSLDDGVVYLLTSEVIRLFIDARQATGLPRWVMCGVLWGNSSGLAYFKRRAGFKPYRASFTLEEPTPVDPPEPRG